MLLYYFTSKEHGLSNLVYRRIRISRVSELNDPFEFVGVDVSNKLKRETLKRTRNELFGDKGLICFSRTWSNPLMWGHYADRHRGICLGFNVSEHVVRQVSYVNSRFPWPKSENDTFMKDLLYTKFAHWSYEDEYRAYLELKTSLNGHFFANFSKDISLARVILGSNCDVTRSELSSSIQDEDKSVECFKSRPSFKFFRVVRNRNDSLWT
jgi:hypothetical protein